MLAAFSTVSEEALVDGKEILIKQIKSPDQIYS
jgi:hypothetical protein